MASCLSRRGDILTASSAAFAGQPRKMDRRGDKDHGLPNFWRNTEFFGSMAAREPRVIWPQEQQMRPFKLHPPMSQLFWVPTEGHKAGRRR